MHAISFSIVLAVGCGVAEHDPYGVDAGNAGTSGATAAGAGGGRGGGAGAATGGTGAAAGSGPDGAAVDSGSAGGGGTSGAAGTGGASADGGLGCSPLYFEERGEQTLAKPECIVDQSLAACAARDIGALVVRTPQCTYASADANGCQWIVLDFAYALVLMPDPFGGCQWPTTIDTVQDCGDHIEIAFSVMKPCTTCSELEPLWRGIQLLKDANNDLKPVHAVGTLVPETGCP